jgi:hypothetical protein
LVIIPWLPYAFLVAGFIMGWRYNNAGLVCSTMTLALAYYALAHVQSSSISQAAGARPGMIGTIMVLLPVNLRLQSILTKRRVLPPGGLIAAVLILFQIATVVLLHHHAAADAVNQGQAAMASLASKFSLSLASVSEILATDDLFDGQSLPTACAISFTLSILF